MTIDPTRCKGHAQCVAVAGGVFTLGDDDRGHPIEGDVPEEDVDAVEDAILMCPEAAISWVKPSP